MPMTTAPELPFQNLARQANKMMEPFHKGYYNFCPSETWTPSVNLYETAGGYLVCVDLSGVDKEKIDVEVADQRLKLKGSRAVPSTDAMEQATHAAEEGDPHAKRVRVHLMEIDHGPFCREVELPEDALKEKISATYRNGMLWVEIPKAS